MLDKAIIEAMIDNYHAKVRIPTYNKIEHAPLATSYDDLSVALICTQPGISPTYCVGDIVYVAFEKDLISKPVIVGLLYREEKTQATSDVKFSSLTVDINCSFPQESTINDVELYKNLIQLNSTVNLLVDKLNVISDNLDTETVLNKNKILEIQSKLSSINSRIDEIVTVE